MSVTLYDNVRNTYPMRMRRCWIILSLAGVMAMITLGLTTTPAQAHSARSPSFRPSLPNEQTHGTTHFLIHYTLSGNQAISNTDADGSGVPDYVEQVAEALEYTWQIEIDTFGWAAPPSDGGLGGDDRIDVYLEENMQGGYAGYADSDGGFVGDNPNTPEMERRAAFSYLSLDDDYAELDPGQGETPLELMQATVAHEFNHVVQAGYDAFEPHFWLYEATATWMEDEVYDDVNDGVFYLESTFNQPDICLVAESGWYANWLFLRLISERYGGDVVRQIWEHSRDFDGFNSIDRALEPLGSSLVAESRDYGVAMLLRSYSEGDAYPPVFIEGTAPAGVFDPATGVQGLGRDFVRLSGSGVLTVTLQAFNSSLSLRAVGVRGTEADVIDAQGNTLVVNMDAYSDVFVVVHNDERTSEEENCFYAGYSLEVAGGGTPSPVVAVWQAAHFGPASAGLPQPQPEQQAPPSGQPFTGSGSEFSSNPAELNVDFQTLLPASLPAGYAFDYAYIMTDEDFGASAPYYVPGGGPAANYDYLDDEGNWLSIAESPSPYITIQAWLDDVQYDTPGEIISVSGVEVLLEDLSEGSEIWYSATLILDGLFIVVDGDHSSEHVIALVQGLIDAANTAAQPTPLPTLTPFITDIPPDLFTPVPSIGSNSGTGDSALLAGLGGLTCFICGGSVCLVAAVMALGVLLLRQNRH